MKRDEVVQGFLNIFDNARYLEVGVFQGTTFHALRASFRVAVDPEFSFDVPEPRLTPSVEYHEVYSDVYFGSRASTAPKFNVVYLDGLHSFEQILRDTLNSIECLSDTGVIIIDDVLPSSYSASLKSLDDVTVVRKSRHLEASDGSWMGDVYRLVFFVAYFMQGWKYATVSENHGQMIIWRNARHFISSPKEIKAVAELDYATMLREISTFNIMPYARIRSDFLCDMGIRTQHEPNSTPQT